MTLFNETVHSLSTESQTAIESLETGACGAGGIEPISRCICSFQA